MYPVSCSDLYHHYIVMSACLISVSYAGIASYCLACLTRVKHVSGTDLGNEACFFGSECLIMKRASLAASAL